jgi:hypothetical protein
MMQVLIHPSSSWPTILLSDSRTAYTSLFLAYQNKSSGWNTCLLFQCPAAMLKTENIVFWFYQALKWFSILSERAVLQDLWAEVTNVS